MRQKDIDVALICESLSKHQIASLPHVPVILDGYDTYENNVGRGVTIISKESLDLTILDKFNDIYSPAIFVKVANTSSLLHLAIVYKKKTRN